MVQDKIIYVEERPSEDFEKLEDRMLYYRAQPDFRFPANSYVMMMLDGKNFSSKVKKHFKLPFDDDFIDLMNGAAKYVCSQVQGVQVAYVQSDEISLLITDMQSDETTAFFNYRICKMLSIIPALATAYFNRHVVRKILQRSENLDDAIKNEDAEPFYQFDAKAWVLPTYNDVFAWFLYRQNDCIRNSKQQAARTYLSHSMVTGKKTDEQLLLLKETKGIDWHTEYDDGKKYGRLIYKELRQKEVSYMDKIITVERPEWIVHAAPVLCEDSGRTSFDEIGIIRDKTDE